MLLACLPFVVRNYRLFGVLGMPNTNVGINFFWANHPIYGTRFEAVLSPEHGVSYQELIPPALRGLNDAQLDRALLARGVQIVLDDPVRYLRLCLSRIPIYFQFWPAPQSTLLSNAARLLSFGLFLPFMLYGLILSIKLARAIRVRAGRPPSAQLFIPGAVPRRMKSHCEERCVRQSNPTHGTDCFAQIARNDSTVFSGRLSMQRPASRRMKTGRGLAQMDADFLSIRVDPRSSAASFSGQAGLPAEPVMRLDFLALLWLFMAVYTAVHLASWANVRYRLPVDAVLLIFAGLALSDLGGRLAARSEIEAFDVLGERIIAVG